MGQRMQVKWQETPEELKQLYKLEKHPQRRMRLLAFWHLQAGKRIQDVVNMLHVSYRAVQNWLAWYRQGGLTEVLRRTTGHQSKGVSPYLTPKQQRALAAKVQLGEFRTVRDVIQWVQDRWGVCYTAKGMYAVLKRNQLRPKVPRPRSEKANPQQQEGWKKGA
jgi:transposase